MLVKRTFRTFATLAAQSGYKVRYAQEVDSGVFSGRIARKARLGPGGSRAV